MSDWNDQVIEEFRANGGQVGGQFAGAPLLLLHTVGARTGQTRVNKRQVRATRTKVLTRIAEVAGRTTAATLANVSSNDDISDGVP